MGRINIEVLLHNVWLETEKFLLSLPDGTPDIKRINSLKDRTSQAARLVERQLSYTFVEMGVSDQVIGHRVDAVLEHAIMLSNKAYQALDNVRDKSPLSSDLLTYFLIAMDNLMENIRSKFSRFQYAHLTPPPHYVKYMMNTVESQTARVLQVMEGAKVQAFLVCSLRAYFNDPVPPKLSPGKSIDRFVSLDYFVGMVTSLYEVCTHSPEDELEESVFYVLISRNFNCIPFMRALVKSYRRTWDDPVREMRHLLVMEKEIRNIPVQSGLAYIPPDTGLKEFLLKAIDTEIKFLKNIIKHAQYGEKPSVYPTFVTANNVLQVIMLFNALLHVMFLKKTDKNTLPRFIQQNFIRANGEVFSLGSLQKKNSQIDRKNAERLVETLNRVIDYIKRFYL